MATNSNFSSIIIDASSLSNTDYTPTSDLSNNITYYWRVLASNSIGNSPFSNIWWFKIDLKGTIRGDVDSPDTWGQYNATVQAVGPMTRIATTGLLGGYTISDLSPGNYTVTCSKTGYVSSPSSRSVTVTAGQTTNNIDFDLTPTQSRATILLSSDSAIRNASSYYPYVKALRSQANKESLTASELLTLTTPVIPILSSGEVGLAVETSRPILVYTIGEEKPERVVLSGTGTTFASSLFIKSTTPEGTATFGYSALDETGTSSDQIEYGQEFVIDTTIYPDEGGYSQNRDGSSVRLQPGALPIAVNITITQPQSQRVSTLIEDNSTAIFSTMRQFSARIDGKEVVYEGRAISSINQIASEIKGLFISLPYQDQNQDGIEDIQGLDENSLKIYQLRPDNTLQGIEDCQIDRERNIVSASVNSFGTYILSGARVITDINSIISYPNPWYPEKESFVRITFIPLNSNPRVYIYNIAGELVRTLDDNQEIILTGQGYLEARWDGRNDSGRNVAYGVYIYVTETDKGTKKGKMGVIR